MRAGDCLDVAVAGDGEPGPDVAPGGGDKPTAWFGAAEHGASTEGSRRFPVAGADLVPAGEHDTVRLTSRRVSGFARSSSSWIATVAA